MSEPQSAVNCPKCGQALTYRNAGIGSRRKGDIVHDAVDVHLYFCERDGLYNLWPDGRLTYVPSSYRPTAPDDFQ